MLNDISYLDKEERIKSLIFDNINKNQSMITFKLNPQKKQKGIENSILSEFFDKTWDKFSHTSDSPSFEYVTNSGELKFTSTATLKLNDIKSVIDFLLSEEYEFKSFIIYNLYRDNDFVYLRFATVDDIPTVIRENRNKKIDNILNGK
jgi:hypothetical protein